MKPDPEHRFDKLGLMFLAGGSITVLGLMVGGVFWARGTVDKGDVLLGVIANGLILFLSNIMRTIQLSWEGATWAKMAGAKDEPTSEDPTT